MKLPDNLKPFYRVLTDDEVTRVYHLKYLTPARFFYSNKRANFLRKRGADVRWRADLKNWMWYPASDVRSLFFCPKCGGQRYRTETTSADSSHGSSYRVSTGYCAEEGCDYWFSLGYTGTVCTGKFKHDAKECIVPNVVKRVK